MLPVQIVISKELYEHDQRLAARLLLLSDLVHGAAQPPHLSTEKGPVNYTPS